MCTRPLTDDQRTALLADEAAARLARSQGVLELGIGVVLDRLFRGDGLIRLGYAKEADYTRERLGIPPRTMYMWLRLARGLAGRPLLRRAVAAGVVSPRKALAILPVAVGKDEGAWTAAAFTATLAELEAAVRAEGKAPESSFDISVLRIRMTTDQRERLDFGLDLANHTLGFGRPRWQCAEVMCQEWLGEFGHWVPARGDGGSSGEGAATRRAWRRMMKERAKSVARQLAAIEDAALAVEGLATKVEEPTSDDPVALDALARRLVAARWRFDESLGALAFKIRLRRYWETLAYRSFEEYCRERLGMSARVVRQRVWLERRMRALPALREALASGRLTYSKALLVARDAKPWDVEERIEAARRTTHQQTQRESDKREERRNRADGVQRIWGPRDVAAVITDAILSAQALVAAHGATIDPGEALAIVADHFMGEWWELLRHSPPPTKRLRVFGRTEGICSVPGCSRPAKHLHHVRFRSHGGNDAEENLIGVCAAHHLRAIHRGHLQVEGRAGEWLVWSVGRGETVPLEVWVTEGDDRVRRPEPNAAAAG